MARDEKIDLLRTVPLFGGLRDRELERISALADIIDLPADRTIMTQGERGAEMFVLVTGNANVERDGASLGDRGPGEVLGEIALLDGGPRTATVTLTEPSRLLVLARREFQALLDEFPEVRLQILETVAHRLRSLDHGAVH
ncbi:MAG TPA: cyclic nucleotide-binding domain-containing protein [Candidatus Limnocylindrales bacterium]|nr:cyclic nucleotide-binding domain-containing protein [Candidatus Limnocylindrales bacterium]